MERYDLPKYNPFERSKNPLAKRGGQQLARVRRRNYPLDITVVIDRASQYQPFHYLLRVANYEKDMRNPTYAAVIGMKEELRKLLKEKYSVGQAYEDRITARPTKHAVVFFLQNGGNRWLAAGSDNGAQFRAVTWIPDKRIPPHVPLEEVHLTYCFAHEVERKAVLPVVNVPSVLGTQASVK